MVPRSASGATTISVCMVSCMRIDQDRFVPGADIGTLSGFVRSPVKSHHQGGRAVKGLVPILTLILAAGFITPAPKNQSSCEKAGMNWDATASAPKVKCNSAVA